MDFFAAQGAARRRTRWMLAAYAAAVGVVVLAITWVVLAVMVMFAADGGAVVPVNGWIAANLDVATATALLVLGVIALAALYRVAQLRGGGGAVARALGGVRVTHDTSDPRRRRLLNVVEEMAIASGTPVPEVYVLEQETAVNAFAAGFTPADAAVAVTAGALERLNRAELQGVIGHEFSHVLNGDMRLNTRLAGPLFGLLVIAMVARMVLRGTARARDRRAGPFVFAALAIMVLGYLGVFFGRLLQAAICRQREYLADASSVQFTRDTTGLRDALVKIARVPGGSAVASADAEDLAHAFIAPAYGRAFATHPPLAKRIAALDPRFDRSVLARPLAAAELAGGGDALDLAELADPRRAARHAALVPGSEAPPSGGDGTAAALVGGVAGVPAWASDAEAALAATRRLEPERLAAHVGNPGLDDVRYAALLREALPAELESAIARPASAAWVWLALALDAAPEARRTQLAQVAEAHGPAVARAVADLGARVQALPLAQHLPLVQRTLPTLAQLPAERRGELAALTRALALADGRVDVFEYLQGALAARYLQEQLDAPRLHGRLALDACVRELGLVFAVLARHGHGDAVEARRAYERGLGAVLPRARPEYAPPAGSDWPRVLDAALERLDALAPAAKELLVEGLGRTVVHDGIVTPAEGELLRAICALLHCPLPPVLEGLAAATGAVDALRDPSATS